MHLRVCWLGVIVGFNLVATNEPDLPVAESGRPLGSILPGVRGWTLADRGYWKGDDSRPGDARPLFPRAI